MNLQQGEEKVISQVIGFMISQVGMEPKELITISRQLWSRNMAAALSAAQISLAEAETQLSLISRELNQEIMANVAKLKGELKNDN